MISFGRFKYFIFSVNGISVIFYPLTHPILAKTKNQILLYRYLWLSVILAGAEVGDHFRLNLYNKEIPPLNSKFFFFSKFLLCGYFFKLFTCIRQKIKVYF